MKLIVPPDGKSYFKINDNKGQISVSVINLSEGVTTEVFEMPYFSHGYFYRKTKEEIVESITRILMPNITEF